MACLNQCSLHTLHVCPWSQQLPAPTDTASLSAGLSILARESGVRTLVKRVHVLQTWQELGSRVREAPWRKRCLRCHLA